MSLPDPLQQRSAYNNYTRKREDQDGISESPDPERHTPDKKPAKHRRNYQACEPCRERKVKCDLGDVDNPNPGPCAKCARESKDCWFNDTRKKGAGSEAARPVKRARTGSSHSSRTIPTLPRSPQSASGFARSSSQIPIPISPPRSFPGSSPVGPVSMQPHLASITSQPRSNNIAPFPRSNNVFASTQNGINQYNTANGHSTRHGDDEGHVVMPQANSLAESFTNTTDNMSVLVRAATTTEAGIGSMQHQQRSRALTGSATEINFQSLPPRAQKARQEALETWKQMRIVRAGWFTPEEALDYIEYFYSHLAPMTPVILSDYRDPSTHKKLLAEEPVLALAILALTSRYCPLSTYSRECRRSEIHKQLWTSLTTIVQRLLWGQEQFGGGFCGAGIAPLSRTITGQITWKGSLRTLGTVEALLLLTDWQPRALHFPPLDHDDKLIFSDFEDVNMQAPPSNDSANLPYSTWLEPAWRSDRMSWMLLGLAQSLSFELGVFDTRHEFCSDQHGPDSDCAHRRRLRRMVITYVSQVSGRIGIQSSLHPSQDNDERGPEMTGRDDRMQKLWFDIAGLMFDANEQIFPSREFTAELVESGRYKQSIAALQPRLQEWLGSFERIKNELAPTMRHVLRMEYEYARLYINSLGLQKVVGQMASQNRNTISRGPSTNLVAVHEENRGYIDEVRDAATQILKEACDGLGGLEALSYSPVRTFLRALSGMMFSLKLLSLGCEESTVRRTFKLLRDMTRKMSVQVVDDLHLSPHTARLIGQLMEDVHSSMIRIPKPGSRGQSRHISPQPNQTGPAISYAASSEQESPDPLAQIRMVDVNNQSFMPPPNFDASATFDANMNFDNMDPAMFGSGEDWISLPIDNLFGLDGAQVNQGYGGIGPTFGDRDMLSLLTDTQWDQNQSGIPQNFSGFGNNIF